MSSSAAQTLYKEFHTPTKAELKALYCYTLWNISEIVCWVEMPHTTVSDITKCLDICYDEPHHCECHFILSEKNIKKLVTKTTRNWQSRILSWKELKSWCEFDCFQWTIKRAMNAVEYHKCKACHHLFISEVTCQKWLNFALKYKNYTNLKWSNWIFLSEMVFKTGTQTTKWVIRTAEEWQHCNCT